MVNISKAKRIASRCAVFALAAIMLGSCSGEKKIISYETGEVTNAEEKSPKISIADINAVLLVPDDPANGACMSAAHANAFKAAASEVGVSYTVLNNIIPTSADTYSKNYNVIFGSAYDYMNPLDESSKNNPDKLYSCFGGYKFNSSNYSNYYTAIYEAQFLAGVAAGTNSESGKIGIISEYSIEYPDSAAEINSFAIGAMSANADIEILVKSLGSRTDVTNAKKYTEELINKGCDVIAIQCDTDIPAKVAIDNDVLFIGYGIDMSSYGELCLTSVVWNLQNYYEYALSSAVYGLWTRENYYGHLADGAVYLSPLSESADKSTGARIESATELITSDKFEIFSNKKVNFDTSGKATLSDRALIDNKSNEMISEDGSKYFIYSGEELKELEQATATSDKLASTVMNYLVSSVTVIE